MKYIYLSGEVANLDYPGFISVTQTRQMISDARAEAPGEGLTVVLNSFGGDVMEGVAIYNLLRASRPVGVVVSGIAASIASVIAMAGDHVAMYSNSTLFVHHAWSWAEGNASQMRQRTAELEAADRVLIDAYMAKSGRTQEEIVAILDGPNGDGSSIDADRALELGLIDEILDPATAVAACLKKTMSEPHHTPTTQNKEKPPMAAEPEITTTPAAECGGTPKKNEEVVEIEKEVEKKETEGEDDDREKRIIELEKKVEELTNKLSAQQASAPAASQAAKLKANIAQARTQAAAQAAQASMTWPEAVKKHGYAKACELYPDLRESHMRAECAKGSIR
jgi:ATP-dependent protease ClpP protease subunit